MDTRMQNEAWKMQAIYNQRNSFHFGHRQLSNAATRIIWLSIGHWQEMQNKAYRPF